MGKVWKGFIVEIRIFLFVFFVNIVVREVGDFLYLQISTRKTDDGNKTIFKNIAHIFSQMTTIMNFYRNLW